MNETVATLLAKINAVILNPLITLAFAIAFLLFVYGIFQFIRTDAVAGDREKAKNKIFYGLLGMFIMFSAYGIIRLILSTFGIPAGYPFT